MTFVYDKITPDLPSTNGDIITNRGSNKNIFLQHMPCLMLSGSLEPWKKLQDSNGREGLGIKIMMPSCEINHGFFLRVRPSIVNPNKKNGAHNINFFKGKRQKHPRPEIVWIAFRYLVWFLFKVVWQPIVIKYGREIMCPKNLLVSDIKMEHCLAGP